MLAHRSASRRLAPATRVAPSSRASPMLAIDIPEGSDCIMLGAATPSGILNAPDQAQQNRSQRLFDWSTSAKSSPNVLTGVHGKLLDESYII